MIIYSLDCCLCGPAWCWPCHLHLVSNLSHVPLAVHHPASNWHHWGDQEHVQLVCSVHQSNHWSRVSFEFIVCLIDLILARNKVEGGDPEVTRELRASLKKQENLLTLRVQTLNGYFQTAAVEFLYHKVMNHSRQWRWLICCRKK